MRLIFTLLCLSTTSSAYNFTGDGCQREALDFLSKQISFNPSRDLTVQKDRLHLHLYNRQHVNNFVVLTEDTWRELNPRLETKIIVYGWLEGHSRPWVLELKDAYLKRSKYNVIVLNWDNYVNAPYLFAGPIVAGVGRELGNFLSDLVENGRLDLTKIHVIGHSLGAQISGFAGKQVRARLGKKVARISGLDAAGPLFNGNPPTTRLDVEDADFVDALHTNGYVFGYNWNYGTVDFYANGGVFQPGCKRLLQGLDGKITCESINVFVFCSHLKSHVYWMESVKSRRFIARSATNRATIVMGEDCPKDAKGVYVLETNIRSPYARGGVESIK